MRRRSETGILLSDVANRSQDRAVSILLQQLGARTAARPRAGRREAGEGLAGTDPSRWLAEFRHDDDDAQATANALRNSHVCVRVDHTEVADSDKDQVWQSQSRLSTMRGAIPRSAATARAWRWLRAAVTSCSRKSPATRRIRWWTAKGVASARRRVRSKPSK